MAEEFTPEEQALLRPFVTNLDKDVFCLTNLPEVVKGALFSRYSRSEKSLRRVLLEEFMLKPESGFKEIVAVREATGASQHIAMRKAEEFYDRVLIGFGDDSVAELGGAHVACENISILATKLVEDARIGISPLEKSTRYVWFHHKEGGRYRYYRDPELMQGPHARLYEETCDFLFETYAKLIEPVSDFVRERFPREEGTSERAYAAAVRAKACDLLRGLLPASTLTNVGLFGNGRAFEYLLVKLYASPLAEARVLASNIHGELEKVIPSFVKRADNPQGKEMQAYIRETNRAVREIAEKVASGSEAGKPVVLVDFDADAEEKVVAAILYPHTALPLPVVRERVKGMRPEERAEVVRAYTAQRKNRRHKPGRAFEHAYYTFDLLGNFGMYRDLHRHRMLTQERQLLGCAHGYDVPEALREAGLEKEYAEAMKRAREAWEVIAADAPVQAQYVVPLAYRIRWYMRLNLRELYHLIELRTGAQGHEDYRRMALAMLAEVERVHPGLVAGMRFVDRREYGLGRLEAEKKLDRKREEMGGA
ncbi:MAG: FAD-dependent thymidylate synthase [Candidatus Micrarchaeia archaeon]